MTLRPLDIAFGIERVMMVSMQARFSGAGRSPGVTAMDILDNSFPTSPRKKKGREGDTKILGKLVGDAIVPAPLAVS